LTKSTEIRPEALVPINSMEGKASKLDGKLKLCIPSKYAKYRPLGPS